MTLLKVMRAYCDEQVMIPAEILHKYMPLRYIERDELLFGQVSRMIAGAQARKLRVNADVRLQELLQFFPEILSYAKDCDVLKSAGEELAYHGLTRFLKYVDASFEESDRARVITYAFTKRLEDARDWGQKLIFVCELFKEDQSEAADLCLDEFLSEIIDGNVVIKVAIGYAQDLATAITSLCATLNGAVTDRQAHTDALMAVSEIMAVRPMPKVRAALLNRIALAFDGKGLLTKAGRAADGEAFRKIVPLLQEHGGFIGGSQMAAALTRRAKVTLCRDNEDLTIEETIETMTAWFKHNAGKIGYLLDILPTDIGKRNASFVTERIAALLSQLRSVKDLMPPDDTSLSSEAIKEAFRNRLYQAGIPRKLADALLFKLDVVSRQLAAGKPPASPEPATLDAPAGPAPPVTPEPATVIVTPMAAEARARVNGPESGNRPALALSYRGAQYLIDSCHETFEIGRSQTSFIVVANDTVSRLHASILAKEGDFVLSDLSRNGTTVKIGERPPTLLHKNSIALVGAGYIALGAFPSETSIDDSTIIHFRLA